MPDIDFRNPIATLSNNTDYTVNVDEAYLFGQLRGFNSTSSLVINGVTILGAASTQTISLTFFKVNRGDIIRRTTSDATAISDTYVKVYVPK